MPELAQLIDQMTHSPSQKIHSFRRCTMTATIRPRSAPEQERSPSQNDPIYPPETGGMTAISSPSFNATVSSIATYSSLTATAQGRRNVSVSPYTAYFCSSIPIFRSAPVTVVEVVPAGKRSVVISYAVFTASLAEAKKRIFTFFTVGGPLGSRKTAFDSTGSSWGSAEFRNSAESSSLAPPSRWAEATGVVPKRTKAAGTNRRSFMCIRR